MPVRWFRPDHGVLHPQDFLPVIEKAQGIRPIDGQFRKRIHGAAPIEQQAHSWAPDTGVGEELAGEDGIHVSRRGSLRKAFALNVRSPVIPTSPVAA